MNEKKDRSKVMMMLTSLAISIILWFWVIETTNPIQSMTFNDVLVTFTSEKTMNDNYGLVITENPVPEINVTVRGERSYLSNMTSANISASVDLLGITEPGTYELEYLIKTPNDVEVTSSSPQKIQISVDEMIIKNVPVVIELTGEAAEGSVYKDPTTSQTVSVSGPSKVLENILYAHVEVDITGSSKDIQENYLVYLLDENGNEVVSDDILLTEKEVLVSIPVYKLKSVPVTIDLEYGNIAYEEMVEGYEFDISYVTILGLPSQTALVSEIYLGSITETQLFVQRGSYEFELPELENVEYVDPPSVITVNVQFTDYTNIDISPIIFNIDEEYVERVEVFEDKFSIRVYGYKSDLDLLEASGIVVDVKLTDEYFENLVFEEDVDTFIEVPVEILIDSKFDIRYDYDITLKVINWEL